MAINLPSQLNNLQSILATRGGFTPPMNQNVQTNNSPGVIASRTSGYTATDEIKARMMGFSSAEEMFTTLNSNVGKPDQFWTDYNNITGKNETVPLNSRVNPSPTNNFLGTSLNNPSFPSSMNTNTTVPSLSNLNTTGGNPVLGGAPTPSTGSPVSGGAQGYDYINDPSYQFRLQEGLRAVLGQASARGMLNSGRTLRELTRYGSDYASQEFGNEFNRRFNLANLGMNAASQQLGGANVPVPGVAGIGNLQVPQAQQTNLNLGGLGTFGQLQAGGAGSIGNAGNLQAAGQLGGAQAWQNTLGGMGNLYGQGVFNNAFSSGSSNPSTTNSFSSNMFSSPQLGGNFSGLRLY